MDFNPIYDRQIQKLLSEKQGYERRIKNAEKKVAEKEKEMKKLSKIILNLQAQAK